jgi:CP family cyanate transporter-like MFS transporter
VTPPSAGLRSGQTATSVVGVLGMILLCALTMRSMLAAVGAAGTEIERQLGTGGFATGLVSTVVVASLAVGSAIASNLDRVLGIRYLVASAFALQVLAFGSLLLPWPATIWVAVTAGGLGAGLIGVALPSVVRAVLPGHLGPGVSMVMVGSSGGIFLGSLVVAELVARDQPWRYAAVPLGVIALAAMVVWGRSSAARQASEGLGLVVQAPSLRASFQQPWVRLLSVYLALQSVLLFGCVAWLVPTLVSGGMPAHRAGAMLAVFSVANLTGAVGAPLLAQRSGRLGGLAVASACTTALSLAVFLVVAASRNAGSTELASSLAVGGAVAGTALGLGASFSLVNFAVAHIPSDSRSALGSGSAILLVSLTAGALGPLLLGAARDLTGDYAFAWGVMTALAVAQTLVGIRGLSVLGRASRAAAVPR